MLLTVSPVSDLKRANTVLASSVILWNIILKTDTKYEIKLRLRRVYVRDFKYPRCPCVNNQCFGSLSCGFTNITSNRNIGRPPHGVIVITFFSRKRQQQLFKLGPRDFFLLSSLRSFKTIFDCQPYYILLCVRVLQSSAPGPGGTPEKTPFGFQSAVETNKTPCLEF